MSTSGAPLPPTGSVTLGGVRVPGGLRRLQSGWCERSSHGGFDSRPPPPFDPWSRGLSPDEIGPVVTDWSRTSRAFFDEGVTLDVVVAKLLDSPTRSLRSVHQQHEMSNQSANGAVDPVGVVRSSRVPAERVVLDKLDEEIGGCCAGRPVRATAPLVPGGFAPDGDQLASYNSSAADSHAAEGEHYGGIVPWTGQPGARCCACT